MNEVEDLKERLQIAHKTIHTLQYKNYKLKKKIEELESLLRESEEDYQSTKQYYQDLKTIKEYYERKNKQWK